MKTRKIDHFCIAVRNLEQARRVWEPVLGKNAPDDSYEDEPEKIRVARYWIGGVGFELMESTTPDGPVAKWIEKNGEGIMVLGLNVESTRVALKELMLKGYPVVPNPSPVPDDTTGAARQFRDCEFAFIHPRKMNGVLTEIIDYRWDELGGVPDDDAGAGEAAGGPGQA